MKDILIIVLVVLILGLWYNVYELDDRITRLENSTVSMWTSQLETNKVQIEFNKEILDFNVNTNNRFNNLFGRVIYCFNVESEWVCSE